MGSRRGTMGGASWMTIFAACMVAGGAWNLTDIPCAPCGPSSHSKFPCVNNSETTYPLGVCLAKNCTKEVDNCLADATCGKACVCEKGCSPFSIAVLECSMGCFAGANDTSSAEGRLMSCWDKHCWPGP